jgi:hypothetical protein
VATGVTSMTELVDFEEEILEEEDNYEDAQYEKDKLIYDPEKINIVTREPTIEQLLRRINKEELDLAPDFQRHANVWKDDAKSRLIESIIIRIPLPAFYVDATDEDKWLVVDGIQRLFTLKQFVNDKKLKLSGLEYLTNLEGKTYDELERRYQPLTLLSGLNSSGKSSVLQSLLLLRQSYQQGLLEKNNFSNGEPILKQIIKRLLELEEYCKSWNTGSFNSDNISCKVSPESDSRLKQFEQQLTFKCPDGIDRIFSNHARMTPKAWRLHFLALEPGKIIIGYIGMKI